MASTEPGGGCAGKLEKNAFGGPVVVVQRLQTAENAERRKLLVACSCFFAGK